MPHDSGVVRIDENSGRGVALSLDCNGRFGALDPYAGAQLALSEAYRNVAVSGATPLAVTDCLNFGSPEDPEVMWQFSEAVRGLADGCLDLGVPVTGGNVSLYNQTADVAIHPTPVVGVLGVIDDVATRITLQGAAVGDALVLIGTTREELAGGEWAHVIHGHLGGLPPQVNLAAESALAQVVAGHRGIITSAHDLSDGGLAIALAEIVLRNSYGVEVELNGDAFIALFSESVARAVVTVAATDVEAVRAACENHGIASTILGSITRENQLAITCSLGQIDLPREQLASAWSATLPAIMS
jgi:phosphoribosylformylglycinamidine synthase